MRYFALAALLAAPAAGQIMPVRPVAGLLPSARNPLVVNMTTAVLYRLASQAPLDAARDLRGKGIKPGPDSDKIFAAFAGRPADPVEIAAFNQAVAIVRMNIGYEEFEDVPAAKELLEARVGPQNAAMLALERSRLRAAAAQDQEVWKALAALRMDVTLHAMSIADPTEISKRVPAEELEELSRGLDVQFSQLLKADFLSGLGR